MIAQRWQLLILESFQHRGFAGGDLLFGTGAAKTPLGQKGFMKRVLMEFNFLKNILLCYIGIEYGERFMCHELRRRTTNQILSDQQ
ncbi:MAG: hypothetical protein ABIN67_14035, partial [Ferruginibacter sp.]